MADKSENLGKKEEGQELDLELKSRREFDGYIKWLVLIVAICWSLYQIYTALFGLYPALIQRSVTLGFALALIFLTYQSDILQNDQKKVPVIDWAFIFLSITVIVYVVLNFEGLARRAGMPTTYDYIFGVIAILILLEATRRTVGIPLCIVSIVFILYAYLGPYMPGLLDHRGYPVRRIAAHLYAGTEGIFGIPLYVMSTYIYAFILFGAFLQATGGSELFINLAYALAGPSKGGPAKAAVLASGFMGTISGSSLANVVTTGNFTIPLMKKVGYRDTFSGGVEAAASSGGQIMPPVMGAAAFIMAEMTGISYVTIIGAALIPALLYFGSILFMVHFEADRLNMSTTPRSELPDLKTAIIDSFPLLFPIATIVGMLVVGYSPLYAAMYSTGIMIVIAQLRKKTRMSIRDIVGALETAAHNSVAVTAACAICGTIIGVVTLTGVGLRMAQVILHISGGHLFLTLLLTMVASIILGMGMPTTAKYIILATIAAPALTMIGVPLLAAHLFIFYYGILAEVTPPVALTSYGAAAVAGADGMKTAIDGFKMSIAAFIVPFMFVYNPMLVLVEAEPVALSLSIITAMAGVIALGGGVIGHFLTKCRLWERGLLIGSAFLLIFGLGISDVIGLVLFVGVVVLQRFRSRGEEEVQIKGGENID